MTYFMRKQAFCIFKNEPMDWGPLTKQLLAHGFCNVEFIVIINPKFQASRFRQWLYNRSESQTCCLILKHVVSGFGLKYEGIIFSPWDKAGIRMCLRTGHFENSLCYENLKFDCQLLSKQCAFSIGKLSLRIMLGEAIHIFALQTLIFNPFSLPTDI